MIYVNDRLCAAIRAVLACQRPQTLQERLLTLATETETLDTRDFPRNARLAFVEFRTSVTRMEGDKAIGLKASIEAMTEQEVQAAIENFYSLALEVGKCCISER